MSLHRLALRLAAIEALSPSSLQTGESAPTIAGRNVYDTRMDDIVGSTLESALDEFVGRPFLFVYTEEEKSSPYGRDRQNPDECVVTLVVEAALLVRGTVEIDGPDGKKQIIGQPLIALSDRQHEAMIDVLEAQTRRVLEKKSVYPSAKLYRAVAMEIRDIDSVPQRDADKAVRFARRTMSFAVQVKTTAWPSPLSKPENGIAGLPSPLREVAAGLPLDSDGRALCETVAGIIGHPVIDVPATSIGIHLGLHRPFTDPAEADATAVYPKP